MNSMRLIGAVSTPPLVETVKDVPKLRFTLCACYAGFDGQTRMWRHDIDLYGRQSTEYANKLEAGQLVCIEGTLSVRDFTNKRTQATEQAYDIKPNVIMPVSANLVGVTRREDGCYVADETVLNEAVIAGALKTSPYKGPDESHPTVVEVINRGVFRGESVIKGKTWEEDAARALGSAFEGTLVMLSGMLANEFHQDPQTGLEKSGTYVRFNNVVRL